MNETRSDHSIILNKVLIRYLANEQASAAHDLADQTRDLAKTALHQAREIEELRRELRRMNLFENDHEYMPL